VIFLIGSADSGSKAFGAAGTAENRAPANSVVRAKNDAAGMEVDAEAAEDIGIDAGRLIPCKTK
jgi:hypothetical protein